jgi:predicted mannosyl-3-phosphoglycerate phosphatase (HAD superfamily)
VIKNRDKIKYGFENINYFWVKSQFTNKAGKKNERSQKLFEEYLKVFLIEMEYTGQSKIEIQKNFKRIEDIMSKSSDEARQIYLAQTQANKITDEWKAINRAMAAKEMGHEHLFEIFFRRAYELGSVGKQQYREYQLSKLGI